eukprot:sb/3476524/
MGIKSGGGSTPNCMTLMPLSGVVPRRGPTVRRLRLTVENLVVPREIWEFYTVRGMSVIQLGVEPPLIKCLVFCETRLLRLPEFTLLSLGTYIEYRQTYDDLVVIPKGSTMSERLTV